MAAKKPKVRVLSADEQEARREQLAVLYSKVNSAMRELVATSAGSRGGIDWPEQRASEVVAALAALFVRVGDIPQDELRFVEATAEWTWNAQWSKESRLSRAIAALGAIESPTAAKARDALAEADHRFRKLRDAEIIGRLPDLKNERRRVAIVAAWALACGALDAQRGRGESEERAIKRVANGFRMALDRKRKKRGQR